MSIFFSRTFHGSESIHFFSGFTCCFPDMPAQGALEFSRYIVRGGGSGGGPERRFIVPGERLQ